VAGDKKIKTPLHTSFPLFSFSLHFSFPFLSLPFPSSPYRLPLPFPFVAAILGSADFRNIPFFGSRKVPPQAQNAGSSPPRLQYTALLQRDTVDTCFIHAAAPTVFAAKLRDHIHVTAVDAGKSQTKARSTQLL